MSADNGYILRKNKDGKYCLQEYIASFELPKISETPAELQFDEIETAIKTFGLIQKNDPGIEYGLSVDIAEITHDPEPCWLCHDFGGLLRGSSMGTLFWSPNSGQNYNENLRPCPVCQEA